MSIFQKIFWQPLFNLLILFYVYTPGHDFGIAVILFTVFIRLLLWPLQDRATKSQLVLQKIQPQIKELQEKYKNDKETLNKEFLALYKGQKINPLLGIIVVFLQLPILFALYRVFLEGLNGDNFIHLYGFIPRPEIINTTFLGIVDLNQPNIFLAFLAALLQFFQITTANIASPAKKGGFSANFQKNINYFMPALLLFFLTRIPSAIAVYLIVSTLFTIVQQKIIKRKLEEEKDEK